jgi:hypothetical protein
MSTYLQLQTRICDELGRNDLLVSTLNASVSPVQNAILSAIDQYAHERFWFNTARATATTTAPVASVGTPNYALPTDCLELDTVSVTVNGARYPMQAVPWPTIDDLTGVTVGFGKPLMYAVYDEQIWLYPEPDAAYTLTLSYLQELTALSASSDTNAWTTDAEGLIRTRAKVLLYLETVKNPEAAASLEALEQDLLQKLRAKTGKLISTGRIRPTEF